MNDAGTNETTGDSNRIIGGRSVRWLVAALMGAALLGLAALLVSIPTLFDVLAVIAFGISVFLHGF